MGGGGKGIVPLILNLDARDLEKRIITCSCWDSNPEPSSPVSKSISYLTCSPYIKLQSETKSHSSPVRGTSDSCQVLYTSVSQPLSDRGPVNSFFIRRGPGPNKFTRKYLSILLSSYIKLT